MLESLVASLLNRFLVSILVFLSVILSFMPSSNFFRDPMYVNKFLCTALSMANFRSR